MKSQGVEDRADRRGRRIAVGTVPVGMLALLVWLGQAPAAAQDDPAPVPPRRGYLMRITLPITPEAVGRAKQFVRRVGSKEKALGENVEPVLIFEFVVPPDQQEYAKDTDFSDAQKLALLLSGEEVTHPVAYIPQSLAGHAVLAALACEYIIMPADAELGPVDDPSIGNIERTAYTEIAGHRSRVPSEVALWLLDPSHEVLVVQAERGRKYVTPDGLRQLQQRETIDPEKTRKLYDPEDPEKSIAKVRGLLTGEEARGLNFVSYLADNRQEVAKALELPPEAVQEDFSLVGKWEAVRVDLDGPISATMVRQAQNMIEKALLSETEVNLICLGITSEGGSLPDAMAMAVYLADMNPAEIRTVAYIDSHARAEAALIALACDQVIMHPNAKLGGRGEYRLSEEEIELARRSISDPKGSWAGRPWSLVAAMIDPNTEVFRYTRPGEEGYFCDEELEELQQKQPDGKPWKKGAAITPANQPLEVDGDRAVAFGLADRTVDGFGELAQHYGVKQMPQLKLGWADFLIAALASPGVSALLLTIAFVALYAELHAPGLGIGGFVATVCFLLFFWAHYLDESAEWLEIILFLTGVCFLALEVFVLPGFGVFGLGGGCLVLVSLILASQTFIFPNTDYEVSQLRRSLTTIVAAGAGIVGAAVLLRRWLPHAPIFNRMMLAPPEGKEAAVISQRETTVDLGQFVGARGVATTQLTPSGKARFNDMLVDVITDGDVLPRGTRIEVVEVHGNRIVVRAEP